MLRLYVCVCACVCAPGGIELWVQSDDLRVETVCVCVCHTHTHTLTHTHLGYLSGLNHMESMRDLMSTHTDDADRRQDTTSIHRRVCVCVCVCVCTLGICRA